MTAPFGDPAERAHALLQAGRPAEALAVAAPIASGPEPSDLALAVRSMALKALGRKDEALEADRDAVARKPQSGIARHNLAATAMDLGLAEEARAAIEAAFKLRLDAPETWLVYAHALEALGDVRGALRALRETLKRRPADPAVSIELAQLAWMATGDAATAVASLKAARAAHPGDRALVAAEVKILEAAGQRGALRTALSQALAAAPGDGAVLRLAAQARLDDGELDEAGALAERALAADGSTDSLLQLAAVRMAQGRPQEAFDAAEQASRLAPDDQATWGWLATAARALGHPAYAQLYDYDALVCAWRVETPEGWRSREAWLADLAAALRRLHVLKAHPSDQSLRQGVQTRVDLRRSEDPAIRAFFQAIAAPIKAHMAALGRGPDPLRARNSGAYEVSGAWSVLLRSGGWHIDHFHPQGWLSSAFYVETPAAALDREGREGWIRFGQPPVRSDPPQPAAHFVKPEPGMLVLFPSYMWHGTIPFTSDESRMTIAFDVLPA
jgi:uncharacterized protein (TIGR02466 family)